MRVQFDAFLLDSDTRQLRRDDVDVHLSPKAFDVLCLLIERRPAVIEKAALVDLVWPGTFVVDANLSVVVAEVRRVLGDDPQRPRFIRTVHRHGYAFCADAVEVARVPAAAKEARAGLVVAGRVLWLAPGENLIGRDPGCDVWLDVAGVSRRHARIVLSIADAVIEDLGSKNGTIVALTPVTAPRALQDGDAIVVGGAELVFRRWSSTGADTEKISKEGSGVGGQ